jgi:bifunctional non-homologous end joining protein LigD
MTKLRFGRYTVEITNPDKVLFPDGITKGELIEYYAGIAPIMLPYLKDRPLMMHRFPNGIEGESFYQKDASPYFPPWIKQVLVPKEGGYNSYVVCQNQATLVYLANQACITPHVWLSKIDKLHYPDKMIFDLDPSAPHTFKLVCHIAEMIKTMLEEKGLHPYVMTTGSHGLHVTVPLDRTCTFETVKKFARMCAQILIEQEPAHATLEIRKDKRQGRVFIDTLRNQYASTAVSPYAVRAHPGAPVATPLYWDELKDPSLSAQAYTIKTIGKRLQKLGDPWKTFNKHKKNTGAIIRGGLTE